LKMNLMSAAIARRNELKKENDGIAPKVISFSVKIELSPGDDKGTLMVKAMTGVRRVAGSVEIEYFSDSQAGVKPPRAVKIKRDLDD
jgi:hypothetical protein